MASEQLVRLEMIRLPNFIALFIDVSDAVVWDHVHEGLHGCMQYHDLLFDVKVQLDLGRELGFDRQRFMLVGLVVKEVIAEQELVLETKPLLPRKLNHQAVVHLHASPVDTETVVDLRVKQHHVCF